MQEVSLQNFKRDIDSIREYINHINLINRVEANNRNPQEESLREFSKHLHSFGTDKKLFEYKAIIMSLYGILEKYISDWIKEHIDTIPNLIPSYDKLPEEITKNHFDLSIDLISLIKKEYDKYVHLRKEDVLTRLSSCINTPTNYKLNSDSFIPKSGNLKHSKVVEAFSLLNIKDLSTKLKNNNNISGILKEQYGDNIANTKDELLFQIINDLVTRRNEIAHGVNIDEILGVTEFDDYIDFLEKYGQAIFETLVEKEVEYEALFLFKSIERVIDVFSNKILCFEIENSNIKVGDYIIVKNSKNYFTKKEVLEIQKDNKKFNELNITEKTNIGVNLGGGIKDNQTFYIKINS